jgi:hypothetical protein
MHYKEKMTKHLKIVLEECGAVPEPTRPLDPKGARRSKSAKL